MNDNNVARQRIIIAVIAFIVLFVIISIVALVNSGDKTVPVTVSSLPETSEVPTSNSRVYGTDGLITSSLSTLQVTKAEQELENFIASYEAEDLTYVTIEKSSINTSFNNSDKSNEIRFIITSNNGTRYQVLGKYLYVSDMYITISPISGGEPIYRQAYDVDDH